MIAPGAVTLGVLAGGRASRMGGADKAWVAHRGRTLLAGCLASFPGFSRVRVSARAPDPRHAALGVEPVFDREPGYRGPVAGLAALAAGCPTPWLLTVPVDVDDVPPALPGMLLAAAGEHGAYVVDGDGVQPLVALWPAARLAVAAEAALAAGDASARALVAALGLRPVDIAPHRLGNVNRPADLAADAR